MQDPYGKVCPNHRKVQEMSAKSACTARNLGENRQCASPAADGPSVAGALETATFRCVERAIATVDGSVERGCQVCSTVPVAHVAHVGNVGFGGHVVEVVGELLVLETNRDAPRPNPASIGHDPTLSPIANRLLAACTHARARGEIAECTPFHDLADRLHITPNGVRQAMHDIADAGYGQACYNTLHVQHHHATRPDHCDRKNGAA